MAIIQALKEYDQPYETLSLIYPDTFVSEKDKEKDSYKKMTLDYFYTVGLAQYNKNKRSFVRNYELLKGILRPEDFYDQPETLSMIDSLLEEVDLPAYVKHYPILNPPINAMVGEMTKRPDNARVKAFDDDSRSEELQYYTDIYLQYIYQTGRNQVVNKLKQRGQDFSSEEEFNQQVEELTAEKIKDLQTSYTSIAERWGNHILTALKMEFSMKEKSEEAFRDLLVTGREYYHIFEDRSKTGINVEIPNPKNVWVLTTPDKKYTKDAYAAGIIDVMELSEIINTFELTKKEIEHLRNKAQQMFFPFTRESGLVQGKGRATGINSVTYDTYDPLILNTRMQLESDIQNEGKQQLDAYLGNGAPTISSFGNKFIVVRAYWLSKKKMGLLSYIDEEGVEQSKYVDEEYKSGDHPGELELEWEYINQWYQGIKIGDDIYYSKPLDILDYCPIIGVVHEAKNTEPKSLVDLMKPFQAIYNICINQLWRLLEKEPGKVFLGNLRTVPIPKDGDAEDALDLWQERAREKGWMFIDDSSENTGGPTGMNQYGVQDMTYSEQIRTRWELAQNIKLECWELVGLTKQRLGGVLATETATATNTALSQSYAQTEPYFAQHEYTTNQLYQAILDACLVIETKKPESTISYINNDGENIFVKINSSDLKLRDLRVFVTSRAEDQKIFQELRQLAQPMLQNGASVYDIAVLYTTNSVRQMQDIFKSVKEKQEKFQAQEQQMKQQEVEGRNKAAEATLQQSEDHFTREQELEKYRIDTTNETAIRREQLKMYFQMPSADTDGDGVADPIEIAAQALKEQELIRKAAFDDKKIDLEANNSLLDRQFKNKELALKEEELKVKREDIASKERIAKENKGKYDNKSKK